jgi:hypothetical protein
MPNDRKWASWRRDPGAVPGSDLSGVTELDLIDVSLLTSVSGEPAEVAHLGLTFNTEGMTVRTPDGEPYVRIPWESIAQLSADVESEHHSLPGAITLDVQSDRKRHRFVVPNVEPRALTESLGVMSARYDRGESR